ncbi:hypothetical protein SEUCBS140593_002757 [Sporothrix eucalyptigena]|uniref:NACHT-NTPase and P-loop NTPases N-terminal domain-containing protein n=1 Tax=Sporothrix eucalyptigena TaxID=1812306 RepID=A0ABP0B953_9PEZI
MTGFVEAATVLGLISAITGICEAASTVYDAYSDAKGLPNKFRTAADQIPLVQLTLHLAETNINAHSVSKEALQRALPLLEQCKESASNVKVIFDETLPNKDASKLERFKNALTIKRKSGVVRDHMETIVKNLELLAQHQIFQDAETLQEISEAIQNLENASDEQESPQFVHSGSGAINANTGHGTMTNYNSSGSGSMYNAQTQNFGKDH